MAIPISFQAAPRDSRAALRTRLEHVQDDHAEAILAAYDLVQALHDCGVLDVAHSALAASNEILDTAVDGLNTPEAIRSIRNLLLLGRALARIEPESLQGLVDAAPDALAQASVRSHAPVGMWALISRLRSQDGLRGLAVVADLMETLGRHLRAAVSTKAETP